MFNTPTQTGMPKFTFKRGDPHPTVEDRYYKEHSGGKEVWITGEGYQKMMDRDKTRHPKYREENRDELRQRWREQHKRHRTKRNRASRKWAKENPNKVRDLARAYRKNNRGKYRELMARRRARMFNALCLIDDNEKRMMRNIYKFSDILNSIHGKIVFHVDHMRPISKGGLHHPCNMRITTARFNLRKSNKLIHMY